MSIKKIDLTGSRKYFLSVTTPSEAIKIMHIFNMTKINFNVRAKNDDGVILIEPYSSWSVVEKYLNKIKLIVQNDVRNDQE